MPNPIQIRMGGYSPASTGFSRALKLIGDRLTAEFGERGKYDLPHAVAGHPQRQRGAADFGRREMHDA